MPVSLPVVLTIAGFDPSGGAGVTADLSVFAALGLYGTCVITLLTVQSTRGVVASQCVSPQLLCHMLGYLEEDLPAAGVKIGALGDEKNAAVIANFLREKLGKPENKQTLFSVLDPVFVSSSGRELFPAASIESLHTTLLSFVGWITPNWGELSMLTGLSVSSLEEARTAANMLASLHPALNIVVTGGDAAAPTDLLRLATGEWFEFPGVRVESTSTHGTGCAFSSALLGRLVLGDDPVAAVRWAKEFVVQAIRNAPGLGSGKGPLDLSGR